MFNGGAEDNSIPGQGRIPEAGYYRPGNYKDEAREFLREHVDRKTFDLVMDDNGQGGIAPVMAKLYLNEDDWERFIWIENHGSLEGFIE